MILIEYCLSKAFSDKLSSWVMEKSERTDRVDVIY